MQTSIITQRLWNLPASIRDIIFLSRDLAKQRNVGVYVVGGFVRDLLLGVKNFDLDIVVEREGIAFAYALSAKLNAQVVKHRAFGTATITKKDGMKIDIATSRKEYYPSPAVLPRVLAGSIRDDLSRRDFAINAIACHIDAQRFGELVDFFNGVDDLRKKQIRFLHSNSFCDDPMRIIRAVRFEQRLGFRIDAATARAIGVARENKMLEKVQKHRLRDEIILLFKEEDPYKTLKRLATLYNVAFIDARLRMRNDLERKFRSIKIASQWFGQTFSHRRELQAWLMYFALFVSELKRKRLRCFLRMYAFRRGETSRIFSFQKQFPRIDAHLTKKTLSSFDLHTLLDPLSYEVIMLTYALSKKPIVRQRIREFFIEHHHKKLTITGDDLLALGCRPGPQFSTIFRKVFRAKINGKIHNKREELIFAKHLIKKL